MCLDKVDTALARSRLYSFDLNNHGDGNQDLVFIMREPEDVFGELMSDPSASVAQYYQYEEYVGPEGYRVHHANGTLSFQYAQKRAGQGVCPLSIVLYVDGTFGRKDVSYRPCTVSLYFSKLLWLHYYCK